MVDGTGSYFPARIILPFIKELKIVLISHVESFIICTIFQKGSNILKV